MCGIAGFIDFSKQSSSQLLQSMTDSLTHRGPDDSGYEVLELTHAQVGLGQRRLSILDLSPLGHQPMWFENLAIVFNGEIYNFWEIRNELENVGYTFRSTSDTEVILKAWHKWGPDAVQRFTGMFAFCIFDKVAEQVSFVRDRAGVKPLYIYQQADSILFASELKAFHIHPAFDKKINAGALSLFLQYSYIPGDFTIFQQTTKLKPGHMLHVHLPSKKTELFCYWNALDVYKQPQWTGSDEEAVALTKEKLTKAYGYRMIADVPVGIFLSGGYDSTSVAAILQSNATEKLKTFTIGFHEADFNEAVEAKRIAEYLGTDHTEWYITADEARSVLPLLPEIYDEPFADNSTVPTVLVSQLARRQVKVALSADGGDEIFAGYNKFNQALRFTSYPKALQYLLGSVMGFINPELIPYFRKKYNFSSRYEKMKIIWKAGNANEAVKQISQYIPKNEVDVLMKNAVHELRTAFDEYDRLNGSVDAINKMLAIDYKTFLVDNNLVKVDRATMAVGLEGREPMLDHSLLEFLATLPGHLKVRNGTNKWLLKQVVHSLVPKELMERPKRPFIAPLSVWFKNDLKDQFEYYLSESVLQKSGVFNAGPVIALRNKYLAGERVNHQKLWQLLVFQLWYNRWMSPL